MVKSNNSIMPLEVDTFDVIDNKTRNDMNRMPNSTTNRSFREADTPKHHNKKHPDSESSGYPNQSSYHYGSHPQGHHGKFYGQFPQGMHPAAMVSPGGSHRYNNHYYPPHSHDGKPRSPYPQQYRNRASPGFHNDNRYNGPTPHFHKNERNQSMEFSRSVSTSFAEKNGMEDRRDDISLGDDDPWKNSLNQVPSIDFDSKYDNQSSLDRICPDLSSDISDSTDVKKKKARDARTLQTIPSMGDNFDFDINQQRSGLGELQLCSTGSSDNLFKKEPQSTKREREVKYKESQKKDHSSSMFAFDELTMKERRDAPPTKRTRSNSGEERDLYTAFSIESMGSFAQQTDEVLPDFDHPSQSKSIKPLSRTQEEPLNDEEHGSGRDLTSNLSWDIKGQDSFGGGFSVSSHLTDGITDDVLGKSFSFGDDDDFTKPSQEAKDSRVNDHNDADFDNIDPISTLNPSESIDLERRTENHQDSRGFPPNSSTWVSNTSSSQGGSFMESHGQKPNSGPYTPTHHTPFGMRPPHYPNNRHMYRPAGPYMGQHSSGQHSFLPPAFQPPPSGMAGPPMSRGAPVPVYLIPSPRGGDNMTLKSPMKSTKGYNWGKSDDSRLQEILKKYKTPKDWEAIAREFGNGRTAKECNERWIRYLKPGVRKGQWQDHEDAIVIEAVTSCKEQPFTRWSDLAQKLPGRVGKQIRDRWVNHLNPNINHMPFTKEDDMKLWEGHKQLGKRWVEISTKFFNSSRSENHIKNRWYSASFKKFVASEFGPDAYVSEKGSKKGGRAKKQ